MGQHRRSQAYPHPHRHPDRHGHHHHHHHLVSRTNFGLIVNRVSPKPMADPPFAHLNAKN